MENLILYNALKQGGNILGYPKNVEELRAWLKDNHGANLKWERAALTVKEDTVKQEVFPAKTVKILSESSGGFCILIDNKSSWLTLDIEPHHWIFTDEYFGIFIYGEVVVSITIYSYMANFLENRDVRMVLNCSVSDGNYDASLRRLNEEQVKYCLERETRKTGINKLKSQARRLNMEV